MGGKGRVEDRKIWVGKVVRKGLEKKGEGEDERSV